MKCGKGRTRGRVEVRGWGLQNVPSLHIRPQRGRQPAAAVSEVLEGEQESPDPPRSCGAVDRMQSDETL